MGWMIVIAVKPLLSYLNPPPHLAVRRRGLLHPRYNFLVLKKPPFAHSVWHLFVLGGSICHFFAMLNLVA